MYFYYKVIPVFIIICPRPTFCSTIHKTAAVRNGNLILWRDITETSWSSLSRFIWTSGAQTALGYDLAWCFQVRHCRYPPDVLLRRCIFWHELCLQQVCSGSLLCSEQQKRRIFTFLLWDCHLTTALRVEDRGFHKTRRHFTFHIKEMHVAYFPASGWNPILQFIQWMCKGVCALLWWVFSCQANVNVLNPYKASRANRLGLRLNWKSSTLTKVNSLLWPLLCRVALIKLLFITSVLFFSPHLSHIILQANTARHHNTQQELFWCFTPVQ